MDFLYIFELPFAHMPIEKKDGAKILIFYELFYFHQKSPPNGAKRPQVGAKAYDSDIYP